MATKQRDVTLLIAVILFCIGCSQNAPVEVASTPAEVVDTYSNVHPEDYVGPKACVDCHAKQHEQWSQHPHCRMNQDASETTVVGDFNNRRVDYGSGHVVFEKYNDGFFMTLYEQEKQIRQYRVTRTVGSRFTQMYIGLQTQGPEPQGHAVYSVEGKLPFGYWMKRDCWTPESYFDTDRGHEPTRPAEMSKGLSFIQHKFTWGNNCIYCHNTYPYQHRIFFGEGSGFPLSDLFIADQEVTIPSWGPVTPAKLVTLGVSCESCHFGCREHVRNNVPTRYVPSSPSLKLTEHAVNQFGTDASSAYITNSICSQCHCAKISRYPNGAATWNSREALDLTSSRCGEQMKCTDCHNPHLASTAGGLKSDVDIVESCLRCHEKYRGEVNQFTHSKHAASANVNCLDCHMPKIVQGLDSVVRTHHISSPTDSQMLFRAAPNSCNLCHLDKSIRWTVAELEKGWGTPIPLSGQWKANYTGDLDRPVGKVWLEHRFPVIRLVATEAWSRSTHSRQALPDLIGRLKEEVGVNRMFGLFAVERVLGRKLSEAEFNPLATSEERAKQIAKLLEEVQQGN